MSKQCTTSETQPGCETKRCSRCSEVKPIDEFYANKRYRNGRTAECKKCTKERNAQRVKTPGPARERYLAYQREYNSANQAQRLKKSRERYATHGLRDSLRAILKKLGLTLEEHRQMVAACGNLCSICRQPETNRLRGKVRRLHIDHDHKTGKIRELLCSSCNLGLGKFFDNAELLRAAAAYLEKHQP